MKNNNKIFDLSECQLGLFFSDLIIPLLEIKDCVIQINYENSEYRVNYPQKNPLIIKYYNPFDEREKILNINILKKVKKKFQKIAKGDLHILKKYFYQDNFSFEKIINLTCLDAKNRQKNIKTDIIKSELSLGQILIKGNLFDPVLDNNKSENKYETKLLQNFLKNVNKEKENISENKTEKYKNLIEDNNEYLKNLILNKDYIINHKNKNYSDLNDNYNVIINSDNSINISNISNIDNLNDNNLTLNIDGIYNNNINYLYSLKNLELKNYLPNDIEKQRKIFKLLNENIQKTNKDYNDYIKIIKITNRDIKEKAKETFEEYKNEKKNYNKLKKEYKKKLQNLTNEITMNNQNDEILLIKKNNLINNKNNNIKEKIVNNINNKNICYTKEEIDDMDTMINILNTIKNYGFDISKKLNDEEKIQLNNILSFNDNSDYYENNNPLITSTTEGDKIIYLIEDIVNNYYTQQTIPRVTIEQIDTNNYSFDGILVNLNLINDKLITNNGENFEEWLLQNFSK